MPGFTVKLMGVTILSKNLMVNPGWGEASYLPFYKITLIN